MRKLYLLDTNVVSEEMRPRPDARVGAWLQRRSTSDLFLSVLTVGELHRGTMLMASGARRKVLERWLDEDLYPRFAGRTLPVSQRTALRWGEPGSLRQLSGAPLAVPDGLIAATALEHNLTLVTRNTRDFAGLGLDLLHPWEVQG